MNKWIVIELSEFGESCSYAELDYALKEMLGVKAKYFIPIYNEKIGSYVCSYPLISGYVFVKDSLEARRCLENLRDYPVFSRVLGYDSKMVSSATIGAIRRKLKKSIFNKNVKVGSSVKILDGTFKNLIGEVLSVDDDGKKIVIRIKRLSREIITPVPITSVEVVSTMVGV